MPRFPRCIYAIAMSINPKPGRWRRWTRPARIMVRPYRRNTQIPRTRCNIISKSAPGTVMRGCIPALSPAGKGSLITWCGRLELFGFQTLKNPQYQGKVLFQAVLDLGKLCLVQIGVQVAEGW